MPTILTYGDSNTHGTPPTPQADLYLRLGPEDRWPCVMQRALGPDWTLIEEGLPGRTTIFNDPITGPTMNGLLGLPMALRSHGPIDWLTIMLGTNDCQIHHGATAEQITGGLAALIAFALSPEMQTRHGGFRILVIAPPPVVEIGTWVAEFHRGAAKSQAMIPLYRDLAASRGVAFLDASQHIAVNPVDGVHFDAAAHHTLGAAVARAIAAAN